MKKRSNRFAVTLLAIIEIGEGVLALLFTKGYLKSWRIGPPFVRKTINFFIARPLLTKTLGIVQTIVAIWIGSQVKLQRR